MANVVCVFGSHGCGSSTLAICIAKEFASSKQNVALLCPDIETPTAPCIYPQSTKKIDSKDVCSLGKILSSNDISTNDILKNMITIPKQGNLVLLGFAYGENRLSYPKFVEADILSFYQKLADLVDIIVVDCSANVDNPITKIALQCADSIIRCCDCDYKSMTYFASNLKLVSTASVPLINHVVVYPCMRAYDNTSEVSAVIGEPDYEIPFNKEVDRMNKDGELLLYDYPKTYKTIVKNIIKEMNFVG